MPNKHAQIRQQRLLDELEPRGLDALVLNPGSSLTYLTGLDFHLSERPVIAIFRPDGIPCMVVPELEIEKIRSLPYEVRAFTYDENPSTWPRAVEDAALDAGLDYRRVGVEPTGLRVLELRLLEEAAPRAAYLNGGPALTALRVQKDEDELSSIKKAVRVAERALLETLEVITPGITEMDLAGELTLQLFRAGSAADLPFSPIIGFGPNSANPHAVASDRALQDGDLILIDWGASVDGYFSDLTRVFCYGQLDPELASVFDVVYDANQAAREKAGPGIPAGDVDRAARNVIESAGHGEHFTHRTGHGLGRDGHEDPYIRDDNDQELLAGMVFTVEPGIYLPGRGGVRIEDDCVITSDGSESLSRLERRLVNLEDVGARALKSSG